MNIAMVDKVMIAGLLIVLYRLTARWTDRGASPLAAVFPDHHEAIGGWLTRTGWMLLVVGTAAHVATQGLIA